jgi:hypothetical protein
LPEAKLQKAENFLVSSGLLHFVRHRQAVARGHSRYLNTEDLNSILFVRISNCTCCKNRRTIWIINSWSNDHLNSRHNLVCYSDSVKIRHDLTVTIQDYFGIEMITWLEMERPDSREACKTPWWQLVNALKGNSLTHRGFVSG